MASALPISHAHRAFDRLYRDHAADVYRYALALLGNAADAEDVAQTTFMNAYRALERGQRPDKPKNWLIVIAHNVCRQRYRQSLRRPTEVVFEEDLAAAVVPDDDAPTAADIQRALGRLSFNQRAALVLRELEGRSNAEIAVALELSTGAVEMLLFRARRALREQLEGSLTCEAAEASISRQLDGRLSRQERGLLRAHLRECSECARVARHARASGAAWKGLAAVPVPLSLSSLGGGAGAGAAGGGALGLGIGVKLAAMTVAATVAAGGGYEVALHTVLQTPPRPAVVDTRPAHHPRPAVPVKASPRPAASQGNGGGAHPAPAVQSSIGPDPARGGHASPAAAVAHTHARAAKPVHPTRPAATPAHPAKTHAPAPRAKEPAQPDVPPAPAPAVPPTSRGRADQAAAKKP